MGIGNSVKNAISKVSSTHKVQYDAYKKLTENIKSYYGLVKEFKPNSIFGYHPVLKGEVAAIYAKTVKIYKKKI